MFDRSFGSLKALVGLVMLTAPALSSCSDGDHVHPLHLLEKPATVSKDSEEERLRKLQLIKALDTSTTPPTLRDVTSYDLGLPLYFACGSNSCDGADACQADLCAAQAQLCQAKAWLAAASPQSSSLQIGEWLIPPQTSGASVELAGYALSAAVNAIDFMTPPMNGLFNTGPYSYGCVPADGTRYSTEGVQLTTAYSAAFADAYHTFLEATDVAVKASLSEADAQLSSTTSLSLQESRAYAGTSLSRSAAAHLLTYGDSGLLGSTTKGFCSSPDLSPEGRAALSAFRESAISPDAVVNTSLTIDTLLNGVGMSVPSGSIRQRLAELYQYPALLSGTPVEQYYGLTQAAFTEARSHMIDEINAFSRSRSATLPAKTLPGGGTTTYPRFSATAGAPVPLPSAYYTAIARYSAYSNSLPSNPPSVTSYYGLDYFIDATLSTAANYLYASANNTGLSLPADALSPLGLLVAAKERTARLTFQTSGSPYAKVVVDGYSPTDGLRFLVGEDELRCAVQGNIEGASCTDIGVPINQASMPPFGFATSTLLNPVMVATGPKRIYIVRPKPGLAVGSSAPGQYEAITGASVDTTSADTVVFGVVPSVEQRIADILEPSKDWCAHSQVSCAGTNFDERLPLENELSSDQDGVESSWKHYLQQAKDAAAQADMLGTDYINAGVQNSENALDEETRREQQLERADDEIEKLQTTCGTGLDPRGLLNILLTGSTSAPDLSKVTGIQCDPTATNTCPAGYTCNSFGSASAGGGGSFKALCTVDLASLAATDNSGSQDLKRLADCISDQQLNQFTSLGTTPVCVWYSNANPNLLCQGGTADSGKCPKLTTQDCTAALSPPAGTTAKGSTPMGFFDSTTSAIASEICLDLRKLRKTPNASGPGSASGGSDLIDVMANGTPFDKVKLKAAADRLKYEMRYGGYAAIDLDGSTLYETGNAFAGGPNTTTWPCSSAGMPAECGDGTGAGLLCQSFNCSVQTERVKANYLMLSAVLAAKNIGHGTSPFELGQSVGSVSNSGAMRNAFTADDPTDTLSIFGLGNAVLRTVATAGIRYHVSAIGSTDPGAVGWLTLKPVQGTGMVRYDDDAIESPLFAAQRDCTGTCKDILTGFDAIHRDSTDAWVVQRLLGTDLANKGFSFRFGFRDSAAGVDPVTMNSPYNVTSATDWLLPEGTGSITINAEDALNGYELLCAAETGDLTPTVSLTAPPVVNSVADLSRVAKYIQLLAQQIKNQASTRVFSNIPKVAITALQQAGGTGAYPQFSGEMGDALAKLRGGLTELQDTIPLLSNEVAGFGYDIQTLHDTLTINSNQAQISDLQMWSNVSNQLAACASTVGIGSLVSGATVATCANSIAQISLGTKINELTMANTVLESSISLQQFGTKFSSHATNMQTLSLRFSEASEAVDSSLAAIEGLRAQAKVSLARALDLASYQASNQAAVSAVIGNLYDAKQIRYKQALVNAQRTAFLAKRAIEQRLGVRLSELTEPLPLVDAPASWEATGCTTSGVDYQALTAPKDPSLATSGGAQTFAEGFIGDYVTRLENVVESYQLVNNFHEGTDTAVISLRDDIMNVRAPCSVASPNLLYYTSNMQRFGSPGWKEENCATQTVDGVQSPAPNCVTVGNAGAIPLAVLPDPALANASAYVLNFGAAADATTKMDQTLALNSGLYRLSWYTPDVAGAAAGFATAASGVTQVATTTTPQVANTWGRRFITFKVAASTTGLTTPVTVGFARLSTSTASFTVAGAMLELLPSNAQDYALAPFVGTLDSLTTTLPACEDTNGDVFRTTGWQTNCERLCADGYASQCDVSNAKSYCYHQANFSLNQRDIQNGQVLNFSGFARGNFNYRIDSVGVNFVGTGINGCAGSSSPTACSGSGFVPYTLSHVGPFYVRNYQGQDFEAHLFDGNIEHARGLSTERYITNPLSSSDESLIEQYMRAEFQGRPLDGNFVLKVWDGDGTNFDAIKDIQFVLRYRYWTRFK